MFMFTYYDGYGYAQGKLNTCCYAEEQAIEYIQSEFRSGWFTRMEETDLGNLIISTKHGTVIYVEPHRLGPDIH